jgi:F-box and WD-40 domain protein 1/11
VTGGDDGSVMAFSLGGGLSYAFLMARYVGHSASVWSVCVHKGFIASGSDDGKMAIWNLSTGKCVSICEHSDSVLAVTFSQYGRIISAGSDSIITMWDIKDPANPCKLRICEEHTGKVTKLQLLGEDSLVSFGWDGRLGIWDFCQENLMAMFSLDESRGWVCCVDPFGRIVAAGNDGKVYLVTPVSRTECDVQVVHKGDYEITSGALIHDGMMIVTSDGRCFFIKLNENTKRRKIYST